MKHKAILGVARYRLAGGSEGQAKYLAVYEFESKDAFDAFEKSPEFAAAREEMRQTWGDRVFEIKWRAQYDVLKTWKR
jgi:heme-degrading monooxygenase HmoA